MTDKQNNHAGADFDKFLSEQEMLEEVTTVAKQRVSERGNDRNSSELASSPKSTE